MNSSFPNLIIRSQQGIFTIIGDLRYSTLHTITFYINSDLILINGNLISL
jgi:hypothetical protein